MKLLFSNLSPRIKFFIVYTCGIIIIIFILDVWFDVDLGDILIEAHGLLFDLILFGIILSLFDSRIRKKEKEERLKEELDDYKGWDEKEAMYRSVGIIIRLNKLGVSEINLKNQFLSGANLDNINLQKSNISSAKLVNTQLIFSDLRNTDLFFSDLSNADLSSANLSGADLSKAKLKGSNLSNAILINVNLRNATLSKSTDFSQSNLSGAKVSDIDFFKSNLDALALKDIEQRFYIDPIVKIDSFESKYYIIKERHK